MKILVTGAAGFVGFSLIKKLTDQGYDVIGLDNFSNYYSVEYKKLRLSELDIKVQKDITQLDLINKDEVSEYLQKEKPNCVIHLAAQAGVRIPPTDNWKYVSSNLIGFQNLLQGVIDLKIPNFLYASSSSVYGNTNSSPFVESEQGLKPVSFYGATKLCNEVLAETSVRGTETRARGLRFFTVYGPWGRPDMAYFRILAATKGDYVFNLNGDGNLRRDFTYIDDVTSSIIELNRELTQHPNGFSDVVNIGGGSPKSINELISMIEKVSGRKIKMSYAPKFESDVKETFASSLYLNSLIGSKPETSLQNGVESLMNWALSEHISTKLKQWIE